MTISSPLYLQRKVYQARQDRQFIGDIFRSGVPSVEDLRVTASGVTRGVSVAPGAAYIKGNQSAPTQGFYRLYSDAAETLSINPASTFPRVDQIIARVADSGESGTVDGGFIQVVKGVEANGATLNNRTGAVSDGSLPKNWVRLADVLAPVGSGLITEINDRRPSASLVRYLEGDIADLPAPGDRGVFFRSKNTGHLFVDTGTDWYPITDQAVTSAADRPTTMPRNGMGHYANDTGDKSTWYSAWTADGSESRCITSPGAISDGLIFGVCAIGAIASRGPVSWSLAANAGVSTGRLNVGEEGRYRITAKVTESGGSDVFVALNRLGSVGETIDGAVVSASSASLCGIELLEEGDGLSVSFGSSTPGAVRVAQLVVERLGW